MHPETKRRVNKVLGHFERIEPRSYQKPIIGSFYRWLSGVVLPGFYADVAREASSRIKNGLILDVATGPGYLPLALAKINPSLHVYGVDISQKMIYKAIRYAKNANLNKRVVFQCCDGMKLDYKDNLFDMVLTTISLHHFKYPVRVFDESYRVLKPGYETWVFDLSNEASEEDFLEWENSVIKRLNFFPGTEWFVRLLDRMLFRIGGTDVNELSRIAQESLFEEYEVERRGVWTKLILKKNGEKN